MQYRFKQVLQEELARLETVSVSHAISGSALLAARDYAEILPRRTIKRQTVPPGWFALFLFRSLSFR